MVDPLRFVTLSKYPPYHSGHAKQALWNNQALAGLTGTEQHQVTYCGVSADPADDAGPAVRVHHVPDIRAHPRGGDGDLWRAVSARLYQVAVACDADAIMTYYADPHAAIANRVVGAMALAGKAPILLHSLEGTDLLDSICEHVDDGLANVLIADVLKADIVCAVSAYAAEQFLAVAREAAGPAFPLGAEAVAVRYPGLPPCAFTAPCAASIRAFRANAGLRQDSPLISTFGRLEPEKGLETMVALAEIAQWQAPHLDFVIAGSGSQGDALTRKADRMPNLTVITDVDYRTAQHLRAASAAGVFPTRAIRGFVETFCISALEYQALGVPVLATDIGGVPEAIPGTANLVSADAPPNLWWQRLLRILDDRPAFSCIAARFAEQFTNARSAARILGLAASAADSRQCGAKASR